MKILVIKPSSLGDVVHTLPAVAAVRDANPDANITWVINPEWAALLRGNPDVNHVHIFPRGQFRSWNAPATLLPWLRQTRKLQPDVALDFQGLLRSALIARWSRAARIYGMSNGREGSRFFYHTVARVDRRAHAVERYLKLAETFGAPVHAPLRFALPSGDPLPHFDDHPAYVLLHPFARGSGKSLSAAAVERFCGALMPVRVIVVGTARQPLRATENCVDLTNQTTLLQLVWLVRRARWVVSVDSGPMHIAAAVTSRLVSIHTWTDPRRVGPYNSDAWVWKNGELMRVRDLPDPTPRKNNRMFRRDDVDPIVQLIGNDWSDVQPQDSAGAPLAENSFGQ